MAAKKKTKSKLTLPKGRSGKKSGKATPAPKAPRHMHSGNSSIKGHGGY